MTLLKEVLEALIFASQKPLSIKEMQTALRTALDDSDEGAVIVLSETTELDISATLEDLRIDYIRTNRAFQLVEQASGWAIVTRPDFGIWVRQLYPESKPSRLSGPALETLAIVAYRQPITKAEIEAVRGVAVDGVMQSLQERSLVRIAGRAEIPGRPLLYETTEVFMDHFGLRNLEDLPNSSELRRLPVQPELPYDEPPPQEEETPEKEPTEENEEEPDGESAMEETPLPAGDPEPFDEPAHSEPEPLPEPEPTEPPHVAD